MHHLRIFVCCIIVSLGFYLEKSSGQLIGNWNGGPAQTITSGSVGIGLNSPRAWQEIWYCPGMVDQTGLIVTRAECNLPSTSNNPSVNPGYVIPGTGTGEVTIPTTVNLNFRTLHNTTFLTPLVTSSPLLWLRSENKSLMTGSSTGFNSRFIVLPNGKTGINTASPRAYLDVRVESGVNEPAAIFGQLALGTTSLNPLTKMEDYFTRHVMVIPTLGRSSFNSISQQNDIGIFFSDGLGLDGSNKNSSFVIAPQSANGTKGIGGLRMDALGNIELRGNLRATGVVVDQKWWPDFVFQDGYELMPLGELEAYINKNKHLPGIPTASSTLANGADLGEMNALLLKKVEELTLYIIEMEKRLQQVENK